MKGKKTDGEILNPLTEEDPCGGEKERRRKKEESQFRSRLGIALSAEAHLLHFTDTVNTVATSVDRMQERRSGVR